MATNLYRFGGVTNLPMDDTPTQNSHYPVESGAIYTMKQQITALEGRVAVNVAEASGGAPTKAEFDALLTALINAGLMAEAEE